MALHLGLLIGLSAGVLVHLCVFKHGEWHMSAPHLLAGHILIILLKLLIDFRKHILSHNPLYDSFEPILGYLVGLFSSIVLYRLSPSHRLRKFNGPRLAAVSKLWQVWQCRDSRNHELMYRLHEKYGDFVRTGPSEIASFHPDSFSVLEGFGTKCTKSDFYDIMLPNNSIVFTRSKPIHDARRSIWSTALSTNALSFYQDRINRQVVALVELLSNASTAGKPLIINDIMYWYAFDAMGEFAFNQDFGMLRGQEWHFAITLFQRAISIIGPLAPVMWVIKIGFAFLPWFWKIKDWNIMLSFCRQRLEARVKTQPEEKDMSSYFIEEAERDKGTEGMYKWLEGEASTVIVAGSDTTAPTLIFLLYCIAKHRSHAEKIYKELEGVDPFDLNTISGLPHLNGAIHEAMRLYPIAPTTIQRLTPPEGVMLGGTLIPGDTKVLLPRWVIFKREDCFVRGNDFIPERWYSQPELILQKRAFAPFGTGRASCVGQGLAMTQLRLVLASIVKKFHVRFLPGDDGQSVLRDMRDQLTAKPGPLELLFAPRTPTEVLPSAADGA